jgi:beta-glucosidase
MFLLFPFYILPVAAQSKNGKLTAGASITSLHDAIEKFIHLGNLIFRDFNKNGKLDIYEDYRKPVEQRAQDLLSKMTMEEKLVQLQSPWMGKAKLFTENKFNRDNAMKAFPNGLGEILSVNHGSNVLAAQKTPNSAHHLSHKTYEINDARLGKMQ